ncbi:transmembrane protein 269 isoform X2 [Amblyraja radiata]|uniref:transmembrane protein 269 isoform X2 n=1 Tax=Amblyraja radiata TaxID=386614 RepID=UPI001402C423|nr:transmembrane protein 269 isoform X2 [Amblyraja radiata]XP_032903862.1 transmembrane protein 269 isoform X2 [Amblyraja radiata]XP_032903863.1 transmembrane protein 269 isoform X2 [Amblyraja radiata]XP_032903864.1 transmembrane protein 269 isoform X2 [Amblyraja radiata]
MFILNPPSSIFHDAKKLFLSEQAGRAQIQDFACKNAANVLSLSNLVMGLSSILCTLNGQHLYACWLILFGFLLDLADGAVARQLNACSALGAKLDDFADFTTFGIATSLLLQAHGILSSVFIICYVMAVFIRLCFFSSGIPFVYRGLPCPYASVILSSTFVLTGGNCFFLHIAAVVMILFMTDQGNYPHDRILETQLWKKTVYIGGEVPEDWKTANVVALFKKGNRDKSGLMMLFCCPLRLTCIYYLIWCFSYTLFPSALWSNE